MRFFDALWRVGLRVINLGKRLNLPGAVQRLAYYFAGNFPSYKAEVLVKLPFGLTMLVPPSFPGARSYVTGFYEPEVTNLLLSKLKQGMTFVDIGAFVGYYTLLGSKCVGSSGKVYSFEPHPVNYAYLLKNIKINRCSNVVAVNKAVSNFTGSGYLTIDKEADHHRVTFQPSYANTIEVQTITLDDFFASCENTQIDLIKMDIEGHEIFALQGMKEIVRKNPNLQLIMEFDPHKQKQHMLSLNTLLQELGFVRGYVIERKLREFNLREGFPTRGGVINLLLRRT